MNTAFHNVVTDNMKFGVSYLVNVNSTEGMNLDLSIIQGTETIAYGKSSITGDDINQNKEVLESFKS